MTTVKGHLFQVECWAKISQWASLEVFMAKGKLAKAMSKALKGKKYFWHIYL